MGKTVNDHDEHDGHVHAEPTPAVHDDHDDHDHAHDNEDHDHDEHDGHDHAKGNFFQRIIGEVVHSHSHEDEGMARYMQESKRGIWALKVSLAGLIATATFQVVIAIISSSAGLLADTIHNFSDALTAIPLWVAFLIGRRQANYRYTYGYGRAEDLAGLFVVLMILLSGGIAFYESLDRLINPQPVTNIGWVIAAAIIGFIGNEGVAWFRIKVGTEIGSAALVADGKHARIDGLTSLAVLFGAFGVLLGFPQADPIVGLLITIAILLILKDTSVAMYRRIMDAVEPELIEQVEKEAAKVPGVAGVDNVRGRWIGHKLFAELSVEVDGSLSTSASHAIGEDVRHDLFHRLPRLADIIVHIDPVDISLSKELRQQQHHDTNLHHFDPTLNRTANTEQKS